MTPKQLGLIRVAVKQLGLSEVAYRALLLEHGNVDSAGDLDPLGFERVMSHLNGLGFRSTWMRRTFGERPGMASPRQVELIRHLWREWSEIDDGAGLDTWLERSYGVSSLRFARPDVAGKAITALRKMIRRRAGKLHGTGVISREAAT